MRNEKNLPVIGGAATAMKKLMVAVPSHDLGPTVFAYDLAQLCMFTANALPQDGRTQLGLTLNIGTYVHNSRMEIMLEAIENEVDYLLWLDSDMRFPRDLFARLLAHKLPVVGINYSTRRLPPHFTAIEHLGTGPDDRSRRLDTPLDATGLAEVEAIGFGGLLTRMDIVHGMPDPNKVPWFDNDFLGGTRWVGEDVHFCKLLREAGHRIFVDQDASKLCAHIGWYEFSVEDVAAYNAANVDKLVEGD